jgi:outer membrane protein assembly factor BamA
MGDPTNGLLLIGHIQLAREADYDARAPYDGFLGADAGWGTRSSRFITGKVRIPNLVKGFRFSADAGAVREGRFGFYGLGPEGEEGLDQPDGANDFFRVRRTRYYGRVEVTRHLAYRVAVSVAGGITHYRFRSVKTGDAFAMDFGGAPLSGTDATLRLTLVRDTRDKELVPTKGLLLEAGVYVGSGKFETRPGGTASFTGSGYVGEYLHLRGYFSPRSGTTLAGRVALRGLGKNAPLDARYVLPGWEREVMVYGGADTQRGFVKGRLVGRGVLFSSVEIRHNLIDVGDYGAVTLLAFLDAGRVFEGAPTISFAKWRVAGGGGLALRVVRSALLTFNFATGPDGFTFSMGNGWAF